MGNSFLTSFMPGVLPLTSSFPVPAIIYSTKRLPDPASLGLPSPHHGHVDRAALGRRSREADSSGCTQASLCRLSFSGSPPLCLCSLMKRVPGPHPTRVYPYSGRLRGCSEWPPRTSPAVHWASSPWAALVPRSPPRAVGDTEKSSLQHPVGSGQQPGLQRAQGSRQK